MLDLAAISKQIPPDLFRPAPVEIRESQNGDIRIQYRYQQVLVEGQTARFWGGVRVFYGPTILECEELFVDYTQKTGRAVGKVRVTDPDGTLEGADLEFNWVKQTGTASAVNMQVAGVRLKIDKLEIAPEQWIATGFRGTPSKAKRPEFEFSASKLFLRPGKSGRAVRPSVSLFGLKLGTLPSYSFSLDNRVIGLRLPGIGYRQGAGLGLSWASAYLLNDQTSLNGRLNVFPGSLPGYQLELSGSPMKAGKNSGRLSTRSELGDRFGDSWFDSILVTDRVEVNEQLREPRSIYSVGTYWGQSTRGRFADTKRITKPLDVAYEFGGPIGDWGAMAQIRGQRLRGDINENYVNRGLLQFIASSPHIPLNQKLGLAFRFDGGATAGGGTTFSWMRGSGYLLVTPDTKTVVAVGGIWGEESGQANFGWDRLYSERAFHARADVNLGSIKLRGLVKYDFERESWYDVEYGVSFVAGSFEPFFAYRQFPREIQFGVRLRLDEFIELLTRRDFGNRRNRTGAGTKPAP